MRNGGSLSRILSRTFSLRSRALVWRALHTCWEHYLSGVWDKNSGVIISSFRGYISADMLTWLRIKKINVLHVGMNKSHAILFVLHFDKLYLACGRQYSFPISFVIFLYIQGSFLLSIAATILHKDYFNLSNSDN